MPIYAKESLELLRQRIDLVEVLSSHVVLHRAGTTFKGLCPFHEEKSPSFIVQRGETHYHCYGCGAHGDAISFLMTHVKMGFIEAIESLAERFQVTLEKVDAPEKRGPNKAELKAALEHACRFYHFLLLHSQEAEEALHYLYKRGLDLAFLQKFTVGFAPRHGDLLLKYLRALNIEEAVIKEAGLMNSRGRDFFSDRITFPIRDALGAVIGFSARKLKEETFGGKYINTSETPLFKKSHVLFGLSYARQQIAKEQRAIIVEGQIDALQLIHAGFSHTVAGQGTAFGEEHVKELLQLGVRQVDLALDGDAAGQEAAAKIGHLFQKKGVEVRVVTMPLGADPDSVLKEWGPPFFGKLLAESRDYLTFLFHHLSQNLDLTSPSQKNAVVQQVAERIRQWEQPVMVHESLRKLAEITHVPESALGVGLISLPDLFIKKSGSVPFHAVDPDRILETDLLRWLLFLGKDHPRLVSLARANVQEKHFRTSAAKRLYVAYLDHEARQEPCDLIGLGHYLEESDDPALLTDIMQRKINLQKGEEGMKETLRKILVREWMHEREQIRSKMHSATVTEEEMSLLAQQFDTLKKNIPELVLPA